MAILDDVREALRISNTAYDSELGLLIDAAKLDLGVAGVIVPEEYDALVKTAIITYCKVRFGLPEDAERLTKSYDEQKAQLSNASGYTTWEVSRNV